MSVPVDLWLEVRNQNSCTYLCQRARPAVVSSLTFQTSFVSAGSPFPKTFWLMSSKNCCAYSSSSLRFAASCACFEVPFEPRGVEDAAGRVSGAAGCLGVVVRFFRAVCVGGIFVSRGVVLTGLFADFGGSLK